ncbi:hypothetical protein D3C85_981250 [compost metagenome]
MDRRTSSIAPTNGVYVGRGAGAVSTGVVPSAAGVAGVAADTGGIGTSPPSAAVVPSGGRLAAKDAVARPFTYR